MVLALINASSRAGELQGAPKQAAMPRSVLTIDTHRCADCGRTPLIGETAYCYARGETVCELCRPLRRAEPLRSEPVRNSEARLTVRVHRLGATSPPAAVPE
jgi:hypothetical protein